MHSQHINTRWSGITGHHFEEEFIAVSKVKVSWNGEYIPYRHSMNLIRSCQAPNSALCETGIRFRDQIAHQMKVSSDEVKVYGSLHTCLDEKHGIDLFVDFRGMTVTIDVTKNFQKEAYKADVIVTPRDVDENFVNAAQRVEWAFKQASRPSIRA